MRAGAFALAAALAAGAAGCASLVPVSSVLESMEPADADLIVGKVVARYPNVGRLLVSESFMIVLDSAVVARAGEGWSEDEQRLVSVIASYMLGEGIGRDWVARVRGERAVVGEGQVQLVVYRHSDGRRHLLDAAGFYDLYLPLAAPAGGKTSAIEAISFDLKISNQPLKLSREGAVVPLYAEILPREGVYTSGGLVFKRWANAQFHLGFDRRPPGSPAPAADGRAARIRTFLENARASVGPVVRLEIGFEPAGDGMHRIALGVPNAIDLVLPNALIAGDRSLESAVAALAAALPGNVRRQRDDIVVKVGYFFFHPHATGPAGADLGSEAAEIKRFRIPPE